MLGTYGEASHVDDALEDVFNHLSSISMLPQLIGQGLRFAFDEVIDGPRTGRYCIDQLEKTEKTYIGTKVEILLRNALRLDRGSKLDNLICGHEVDTKFSLSGNWMIPREAIGELCLLVEANDAQGKFSIGLLRALPEVLRVGNNQDSKTSVSSQGRQLIRWLLFNQDMPRNLLLGLDPITRSRILTPTSGVQRMRALFTHVTGQLIPRATILQVGQQKDSLKRARELKAVLANEGRLVLCATYEEDSNQFRQHGFDHFAPDDWLSLVTSGASY
jgi:hypothetical protein